MAKINKTYRLDESVLKMLEEIQKHFQNRADYVSESAGLLKRKVSTAQTLEFAIKKAYETLEKEGFIQD